MKNTLLTLLAFVVTVTALSAPAHAQLNSMPVWVSPKGGTGFTLAVDYGRGLNDESGKNNAFGARARLSVALVQIGVGVGTVNPTVAGLADRETEVQYMGNAALRVVGGPLVPVSVSVHGGIGYLKRSAEGIGGSEIREINVPLGVALGLSLPTPGFSFDPWVAPRYTFTRTEVTAVTGLPSDPSDTQKGLGLSAGVNLGVANGLGIHLAVDWTDLDAGTFGTGTGLPTTLLDARKPMVFGVSLSYTFSLPGLGVPMVPGV